MSPGRALEAIFRGTIERLDPARRVADHLSRAELGDGLVTLLAAGKAAHAMARGAMTALGRRIEGGLVVTLAQGAALAPVSSVVQAMVAAHPVPDARSVAAGQAMLDVGRSASSQVVALISGGASALIAVPAPGLELADKIAVTRAVYQAGAPIGELNTVRRHVSALKGGRLAAACPVPVLTLVSSDVVGDDLAAVGSGPTVPDLSTFAEACQIVETRCGWSAVPPAVREHLTAGARGERAETPGAARPGDAAVLIAGLGELTRQASHMAATLGMRAVVCGPSFTEDVETVAQRIAQRTLAARGDRGDRGPLCLVFGGESTIRLAPTPGVGGRAQHLALCLAERIRGVKGVTALVCGSDGIDGNSPAAGAIVDGDTWCAVARSWGDPRAALLGCDAHSALSAVDATVVTGPTGVNHADLVLVHVQGQW